MFEGKKLEINNTEWTVLERIGDRSGFGFVYRCETADGDTNAIKFIPMEPSSKREYLLEHPEKAVNVVPIFGTAEADNHYVLLMPLADKSLRKHLQESNNLLNESEAADILVDIAASLASIDVEIVHRDVKPENVLLLDGNWCLADFGIAKYADASTEPATNKFRLTPQYASPEQWRMERAGSPSDIYSFGVLAYELLEGRLPFEGPEDSAFRDQHLAADPPTMVRSREPLSTLVRMCLLKSAPARPSASHVLEGLSEGSQPQSEGEAKLEAVRAKLVNERSEQMARESATEMARKNRDEHFESGVSVLMPIIERLKSKIVEKLPEVTAVASPGPVHLLLGGVSIRTDSIKQYPPGVFQGRGQPVRFDVVAATSLGVMIPVTQSSYQGRAHSLWYCDAQQEGVYRWYELGFGISALTGRQANLIPLDLDPENTDAVLAMSNTSHTFEIARNPGPIDQSDATEFVDRWVGYFADGILGNLAAPSQLPENPTGFHR